MPAQARVTGEIVEFGEMSVRNGPSRAPGPDERTLSDITPMYASTYLNHSDQVEAALCRTFGVTIQLDAAKGEGLPREIEVRVRHPLLTRPDGVSSTEDSLKTAVAAGVSHEAFTFDQPWEAQPGVWEFTFFADGARVASKAFTVTRRPGQVPSICDSPVS